MKNLKMFLGILVIALVAAMPLAVHADNSTNVPAKPYPLKTCLVCDMQLEGMGTPFMFVYKGQEIKVCDKSEKVEFDKDPDKYMKKLADAEAKMKK